jgi:pimeloyl-ACP methyl ester carboxylesterase
LAAARGRIAPEQMFPAGDAAVGVRFVEVADGIRLRVVERGPPDGSPVLLLHGWGGSVFMFRHNMTALAEAGYRAIAVDLRGHGLSEKPIGRGLYSTDRMVADVREVADRLEVPRMALVGQSMGGAIALRLALSDPARVARLALINPAGLSGIPLVRAGRLFRSPLFDRVVHRILPRWVIRRILAVAYGDPGRLSERDVDEYWAPSQFPAYAQAMRALTCEFDWDPVALEELATLRLPILVIVGGADRLITWTQAAAARVPSAKVVVVDGAGHVLVDERPDDVNSLLLDFLSRPIPA